MNSFLFSLRSLVYGGICSALLTSAAIAEDTRVLIIGDSMMRITAHATKLALDKRGGVAAEDETSLGSGLARLDAFDWLGKAEELVGSFDPDITMAWFGTNDVQPMKSEAGLLRESDPGWKEEYARRVGAMMDILTRREGTRVFWLELPVMRDKEINDNITMINAIAKAEADKRDAVVYMPTNPILTRKADTFTAYLMDRMGRPVKVRDADGVHLGRPGADMIAEEFIKKALPKN